MGELPAIRGTRFWALVVALTMNAAACATEPAPGEASEASELGAALYSPFAVLPAEPAAIQQAAPSAPSGKSEEVGLGLTVLVGLAGVAALCWLLHRV